MVRAILRQRGVTQQRVGRRHFAPVDPQAGIAAMVVDANTGRTLYASREDEIRHPASITKVMTLYLLFEQLHHGRLGLDTPISISAHAASQPPTKIGQRPGTTISVENAVKAIVTESANDMAVAVAEAVGGSEDAFAAMMTRKAHALGMSRTVYVNASGLPDDRQVTTARDLTVLGRAIQERFPKEYAFFSIRNFAYGGRNHRNHNHLLEQVDGVDGIKTGYTRASGFNLLASVRRGGRHIISVVIGGRSAPSRDRIMTGLIEEHIAQATPGGQTAPMIAENDGGEQSPLGFPAPASVTSGSVAGEAVPAPTLQVAAAEQQAPAAEPPTAPLPPADAAPVAQDVPDASLRRVRTATVDGRPRPAFVSGSPRALGDETSSIRSRRRLVLDGSTSIQTAAYAGDMRQAAVRWSAGPSRLVRTADARPMRREAVSGRRANDDIPRLIARAEPPKRTKRAQLAEAAEDDGARSQVAKTVPDDSKSRGGWIIQIGATENLAKANALLARARSQDRTSLASARSFTEKVQRGAVTLYRARFAVLESSQAEAACKTLKRQGIPCFATKN